MPILILERANLVAAVVRVVERRRSKVE